MIHQRRVAVITLSIAIQETSNVPTPALFLRLHRQALCQHQQSFAVVQLRNQRRRYPLQRNR